MKKTDPIREIERRLTDAETRLARAESLIVELVGRLHAEPALQLITRRFTRCPGPHRHD